MTVSSIVSYYERNVDKVTGTADRDLYRNAPVDGKLSEIAKWLETVMTQQNNIVQEIQLFQYRQNVIELQLQSVFNQCQNYHRHMVHVDRREYTDRDDLSR